MSRTQVVRFGADTWRKGTRGLTRQPTEMPRISNMRVWDDGSLGPRPLWVAEANLPTSIGSTAKLWPCRFSTDSFLSTGTSGFAAVDDGEVSFFRYGDTTAYATVATTMRAITEGSTLSQCSAFEWLLGRYHLLMVDSTVAYAPVVTDVSTAIATRFGTTFSTGVTMGSCVHQGRGYYWAPDQTAGVGTPWRNFNRIYYSDDLTAAAPYRTFTSASQYFDIDGRIAGLLSLGPNLLIWTEAGDWFVLQGRGDPSLGTLNALGKNRIPGAKRYPQIYDQVGYFLSSDTQAIVKVSSGGQFEERELAHLGVSGAALAYNETPPVGMAISSLSNSILAPAFNGGDHRHLYNGVWTTEAWGTSVFGNFQVGTDDTENREMLFFYNSGTTRWQYSYRDITNDQPSYSIGGAFAEYTEVEDCELGLPRLFSPTEQVRVRRVIIDARTFSSNGTYWPSASMEAWVYDGKDDLHQLVLGPASQPLSGVPNVGHTPIRIVATPSSTLPFTSFSDVELLAMKGIAIESVTVEFEISGGQIL